LIDDFFKKIDRLEKRLEKIQTACISGKYHMPEELKSQDEIEEVKMIQ